MDAPLMRQVEKPPEIPVRHCIRRGEYPFQVARFDRPSHSLSWTRG